MAESALPVVVIVGPTAVGKTEVTLGVARRLGAEVISADSMQVYRGMDVGTAKPTFRERGDVPHHLIDIVDPDEPFSVADWTARARPLLGEIRERGRVPIVSGGTPLYFEALFGRYALVEGAGPDPALRASLSRQAKIYGPLYLHRKLEAVDPDAAARIHPADKKRTIRALEVYLKTGRPLSELEKEARWTKGEREAGPGGETVLSFGLWRPRAELARRIEDRTRSMIEAGLVEEVRGLLEAGYDPALPAMQGVGYKEIAAYLRGDISLERAVELVTRNTRRLAKRQMTWFRADPRIQWLKAGTNMQVSVEDIVTAAGGKP